MVGAYHYFIPRKNVGDISLQVDTYLAQVRSAKRPGDTAYLPAIIDIEIMPGEVAPSLYLQGISAWLAAVEAAPIFAGMKSIIYTRASIWAALGGPDDFADHPTIWVADYTDSPPRVPPQWPTWGFWQYSESASRAGVRPLDLNRFNGVASDLRKLTRAGD